MSTGFTAPNKKAVVFWPVGTGDSTTLVVRPGEIFMQIDLHNLEKADHPDEPEWPVVDHLVKLLPKRNGRPYLAVFVLTHPDKDHILGFAELLRRVEIGELWHTPKIFRAQSDQESLCSDAKAFRQEAHRRRKAIASDPRNEVSGNRLRVIGHDDILHEEEYERLPEHCKSRPGDRILQVDGINVAKDLHVFVHAPFSADQDEAKNNTSLSLNVVLWDDKKYAQFFFFGDREYPTITRIFDTTERLRDNAGYAYWDVMLCAHHCSKAVMYWRDEAGQNEVFKKDIMDRFEKYRRKETGFIISSSHTAFTDGDGDCPPHKKARNQYEKIVKAGYFICTHEYPDKKKPEPIVFTIGPDGLEFDDKRAKSQGPSGLAAAIPAARGGSAPPTSQVVLGRCK